MPNLAELCFADLCFWIYISIALVSLYGFCLFIWWKSIVKNTSEVYNYVMLLFICLFINYALNSWARFVFINDLTNLNEYENFITNWVWHFRAVPNLIIISIIVFRMNQRARKAIKNTREPRAERRQIKRRNVDK